MMPLPDGADLRQLRAWRNAEELAARLESVVDALELAKDREWLRYVLGEALSQLRQSLGYVESLPIPPPGDSPRFEAFTVAASAGRTSIAFLDYALAFMRSEHLLDASLADALHHSLDSVEEELVEVSRNLRGAGQSSHALN